MPCSLCQNENADKENKLCKDCSNFLANLKCSCCNCSISLAKKNFSIKCDSCTSKEENNQKEKLELIKEKEMEIEKANLENNILANKPIYDSKKFIDFYDIIFKINSIRDILNGWNISFSEKGKEYYEKMKVKNFLKIGVTGVGNKGKSFLLQKLANIELPTGTSIKTEGLSIRCPDIDSENQNIILLDSAGSETPLIEDFEISGKYNNEEQLYNKPLITLVFEKSHFDISGKEINDEQSINNPLISITFLVSHSEISGNDVNDEQFMNIKLISSTLLVFHLDISSKDFNEEQSPNIPKNILKLAVFHFDISLKSCTDEQLEKIN